MLLLSFFSWWYGQGWKEVIGSFKNRIFDVMELFSVVQILRTLFAPWRRIISYPGASLSERMRAWGDNVFSRAMGFVVRFFVLIVAIITIFIIGLLTAIEIILWPVLPMAVPGSLVAGIIL